MPDHARAGEDGPVTVRAKQKVPHDPPEVGYVEGQKCPLCDEVWPCAERKRQRVQKRLLDSFLRSALYTVQSERVTIDGQEAIRWQSPLDWYADLTYGEHGLIVVVHSYDGDHRNDDADLAWLDGVLP